MKIKNTLISNQEKIEDDNVFYSVINPMEFLASIFSGLRHEIGNPINSIKMTISVLKANIDGYPKEKVLEYIDRVLMEIERVEQLLKGLKSFSMFERLALMDVQLPIFMKKFLTQVETELKQKKIPVRCHVHPDVGEIYTDPRALQQVLLNILTNAVDALAGVENPMISIDISSVSGKIRVKIADNGPGISEAHKEEVFKPFFTTRPHRTGLGLSIVHNILSQMNGTIRVRSKKNIGTTVIIQIPGDKYVNP